MRHRWRSTCRRTRDARRGTSLFAGLKQRPHSRRAILAGGGQQAAVRTERHPPYLVVDGDLGALLAGGRLPRPRALVPAGDTDDSGTVAGASSTCSSSSIRRPTSSPKLSCRTVSALRLARAAKLSGRSGRRGITAPST